MAKTNAQVQLQRRERLRQAANLAGFETIDLLAKAILAGHVKIVRFQFDRNLVSKYLGSLDISQADDDYLKQLTASIQINAEFDYPGVGGDPLPILKAIREDRQRHSN